MEALKTLTQQQYDDFWRDGFLVVENAVTRDLCSGFRKLLTVGSRKAVRIPSLMERPSTISQVSILRYRIVLINRLYAGSTRRWKSQKLIMKRWFQAE